MTFHDFEKSLTGVWVAVFDDDKGYGGFVRFNQANLATRITNMTLQMPGYDPEPEQAVLVELEERNKKGRTD